MDDNRPTPVAGTEYLIAADLIVSAMAKAAIWPVWTRSTMVAA